jgi:hypothetical protein
MHRSTGIILAMLSAKMSERISSGDLYSRALILAQLKEIQISDIGNAICNSIPVELINEIVHSPISVRICVWQASSMSPLIQSAAG